MRETRQIILKITMVMMKMVNSKSEDLVCLRKILSKSQKEGFLVTNLDKVGYLIRL